MAKRLVIGVGGKANSRELGQYIKSPLTPFLRSYYPLQNSTSPRPSSYSRRNGCQRFRVFKLFLLTEIPSRCNDLENYLRSSCSRYWDPSSRTSSDRSNIV